MVVKMSDIYFTFGVLAYNSELYILETLESIKYQVLNYADGRSIQLIIGDDGSKDNTVQICDMWIKHNRSLFTEAVILSSSNNQGTVLNYKKIFNAVKGKFFHIIAGDDLFNYLDIFKYAENLRKYDIVSTIPISVNSKRDVFVEKHRLHRFLYNLNNEPYDSSKLIKKEMYGSFLHTPSTVFKKELYDENVQAFVEQFFLFEDDPKWYKLLSRTGKLKLVLYPIVLYRYQEKSVSHNPGPFEKDVIKLIEIYKNESYSFLLNIFLDSEIRIIKHNTKIGYANFVREVSYLRALFFNSLNKKTKNRVLDMSQISCESCKYYREILKKSEEYKNMFEGQKKC